MTGPAEAVATNALTFPHERAEGTVYVTVLPADTDNPREQVARARVQVHTDPDPTSGEPHGFVKIRGRSYRIDKSFQRFPDDAGPDLDGNERVWSPEPSNGYREGFRNDDLVRIGRDTRAHDRLEVIVAEVLAMFDQSQPGWQRESVRQALLAVRRGHEDDAERARKSLEEAMSAMADIDAKLAAFN